MAAITRRTAIAVCVASFAYIGENRSRALELIGGQTLQVTPASMRAAAQYSRATSGLSMLVMQDGAVAYEQYDNGGGVNRQQLLASGSKSFVGLAAAAAVQDGLIRLDDAASQAITEWRGDPVKSRITYRQLLSMTSGITHGGGLTDVRTPGWSAIAASPMTGTPGAQFEYGPYQINLAAYAIERRLRGESFENYLKRRILDPLGVSVNWRLRCADGHPQVAGGAHMTARDWGVVGQMALQRGVYNGKQVIAERALAQCFEGSAPNPDYGLTWWLKRPVSRQIVRSIPLLAGEWGAVANCPWLPNDMVAACGLGKQRLYVFPSLKLVVVRQGRLSQRFNDVEFLRLLFGR